MTAEARLDAHAQHVHSPERSHPSPARIMPPHAAGGRRDGDEEDRRAAVREQMQGDPSNQALNKFVKRYKTEIAASSSSVFSTLTAFPLDSVKTRMQTYHYKGFLDCVRHTYHTEKLGGFFRGITTTEDIGYSTTNIVFFRRNGPNG